MTDPDRAAAQPRRPVNFRDVAGPDGYPARDGRMRRGVLFRSTALDAGSVDAAWLADLGLTGILDLRTTAEVTATPDAVIAGADYLRFNIIGDDHDLGVLDPRSLTDEAGAKQLLADVYRLFVTDPGARAEFGGFVRAIAASDGPQVFHCAAGKDRTGWAAAIVHGAVGVSAENVMADYLLTNVHSAAAIDTIAARATAERGAQVGAAARALAGVFPEALQAAFDAADAQFGSFDGYLRDGLGLDAAVLDRVHAKLVE